MLKGFAASRCKNFFLLVHDQNWDLLQGHTLKLNTPENRAALADDIRPILKSVQASESKARWTLLLGHTWCNAIALASSFGPKSMQFEAAICAQQFEASWCAKHAIAWRHADMTVVLYCTSAIRPLPVCLWVSVCLATAAREYLLQASVAHKRLLTMLQGVEKTILIMHNLIPNTKQLLKQRWSMLQHCRNGGSITHDDP